MDLNGSRPFAASVTSTASPRKDLNEDSLSQPLPEDLYLVLARHDHHQCRVLRGVRAYATDTHATIDARPVAGYSKRAARSRHVRAIRSRCTGGHVPEHGKEFGNRTDAFR